jgi:hypothetical protein
MRAISGAAISGTVAAPSNNLIDTTRQRSLYFESADPADLEAKVAAALVALALEQSDDTAWAIVFADLAGGGDGHSFVFNMVVANQLSTPAATASPVPVGNARFVFYLASQAEALEAAAAAADARLDIPVGFSATYQQSWLHGASQGTRVMGGAYVLLAPNVAPVVAGADIGTDPADLTVTGTAFLSTLPNVESYVVLNGVGIGALTVLTQTQIVAGGGTFTDVQIVIPAALIGTLAPGDTCSVVANNTASNAFVVT